MAQTTVKSRHDGGLPGLREYSVLEDEGERTALKKSSRKIVDWMRERRVKNLVAGGFSAKPAAKLLLYSWNRMYPGEETPHLFSLGDIPDSPDALMTVKENMPGLIQGLGEPTLLLEEHVVTGSRIGRARRLLRDAAKSEGVKSRIHTAALFRVRVPDEKPVSKSKLSVWGMDTYQTLKRPSWATKRGAVMDLWGDGELSRNQFRDNMDYFRRLDADLKKLAGELPKAGY